MYFLNGDRLYIKPEQSCGNIDLQITSCLQQLKKINSGRKIFKLNFFVDTKSNDSYSELLKNVTQQVQEQISEKIIISFFAQPPLTCKIIVEAFFYDYSLWESEFAPNGNSAAILFRRGDTEILVGNVHANLGTNCRANSEKAFSELDKLFDKFKFPVSSIVRQWNYLEDILGFDDDKQRYQDFNNVRSEFYGNAFDDSGFPAATGIGMNRGGVIIEFVAVKSSEVKSKPVDNPEQIAAHHYSENVLVGDECVLKTTPKFERARYLELFGKRLIFISGTASIVGEKTIGIDDPIEQTEVTIQNIQRLYSDKVLNGFSNDKTETKYGHARVYIKNRRDFPAIKRTFKKYYGDLPVVYIIADICRNNLLVEIEGKVIIG